jgi:hypothetical protein
MFNIFLNLFKKRIASEEIKYSLDTNNIVIVIEHEKQVLFKNNFREGL